MFIDDTPILSKCWPYFMDHINGLLTSNKAFVSYAFPVDKEGFYIVYPNLKVKRFGGVKIKYLHLVYKVNNDIIISIRPNSSYSRKYTPKHEYFVHDANKLTLIKKCKIVYDMFKYIKQCEDHYKYAG